MASRRSNITSKGRRRSPPFVMIEHRIIDHAAFGELSGNAVKLLILVTRRWDGANNGEIAFSERQASEQMRVSRMTARKAFTELEQAGLIVATERGRFQMKDRLATTWRLTFQPTAMRPATNDWRDIPRV